MFGSSILLCLLIDYLVSLVLKLINFKILSSFFCLSDQRNIYVSFPYCVSLNHWLFQSVGFFFFNAIM